MVDPPEVQSSLRRFWIVCSVIIAATLLTFQGVLQNGFLEYDDNDYVLHNPLIYPVTAGKIAELFARTYFRSYTPLAHVSHAVDFALWGKDPFGHHLTNLLLHLGNAALLFVLLILLFTIWREKKGSGGGTLHAILSAAPLPLLLASGAGSAFFALHPLRVESVAWISDRKDLLMTFFLLLSLSAYLLHSTSRGKPEGRNWLLLSLGAGLLAMLAKTVASMLPLALILLDVIVFPRNERWAPRLREKWGFVAASCFVGVMSILALVHVRRHPSVYIESPLEKVLLPFYSWAFYLGKTLFPADLTPIYVYPPLWQQIVSLVAVAVLTALAVWWYRRKNPLLVGVWGFFLLFLVPTILGREKAGIQPWADRYSYLPSIALGLLFGAALLHWLEQRSRLARWGGGGVASLLLVGCAVVSFRLVPVWRDTETLFRHAAAVNPRAVFVQANLGMTLTAVGDPEEAMKVLRYAAELSPDYAGSYGAMGLAYEGKGDFEKALEMYRKAITLDSNYVDAQSNLGNALMALGRYDEAIAQYLEAIRKEPEFDDAYYNMGIAVYRKGDDVGAMEVFRRTAAINPIRPDTYVNMGIIYEKWGRADSAYLQFARAAELGHEKAMEKIMHK